MFEYPDERSTVNQLPRQPVEALSASEQRARAAEGLSAPARELPHRAQLERSFGTSLAGVKAHTGPDAERAAKSLGAHAFAYRGSVVLGDRSDVKTTAEEAAHALQQRSGSSSGERGGLTDPNGATEREAQSAAENVASGGSAGGLGFGLGFETVARARVRDYDEDGNVDVEERNRGPQRKAGKHGQFRGRDSKRANDADFERVCQEGQITKESGERQKLHAAIGGGEMGYEQIKATAQQMKLGIWK